MEHHGTLTLILLFLSAFGAGVMNAMAGGGTLLTFPSLLAAGVSPVAANATSSVALVPGALSSGWAYRGEVGRLSQKLTLVLGVSSILGGGIGALLVARVGDAIFGRMVPWLIWAATALFILQEPLRRFREGRGASTEGTTPRRLEDGHLGTLVAIHSLVALYGGFFGAGMGIMMLAELGFAGLTNIHQMNGLKNFGAALINLTAAVAFALGGHVSWRLAGTMALGAILGGWGGSRLAQVIGQRSVRWVVVSIGVLSGLTTLLK